MADPARGGPALPRFVETARLRPVDLVDPLEPGCDEADPEESSHRPLPQPAPYVAVVLERDPGAAGPVSVRLTSGTDLLVGEYDGRRTALAVSTAEGTSRHTSRRHGRPDSAVAAVALTLTGTHLTLFTRPPGPAGSWTARARHDLDGRVRTRDPGWLAGLSAGHTGAVSRITAGGFGQLGLRDLRLVTHAGGAPYLDDTGCLLLTATSAGPGFFDTAHASVWALDPAGATMSHRADLFTRRRDRAGDVGVFGDHASHLVRDGDSWVYATSTWGDVVAGAEDPRVEVVTVRTGADLLRGRHVLDTTPLALPVAGLRSVGTWDPHLVRDGSNGQWLVGFVSATAYFRFHPAVATGPTLDRLTLRAAATGRTATEGTTLVEVDGRWWVLASDGRDGPRAHRAAYPVLDLDLEQVGTLDAPYPSNLPWPTLARVSGATGDTWWMVTFDGTRHGGPLPGYGTHGDVVVMRGR